MQRHGRLFAAVGLAAAAATILAACSGGSGGGGGTAASPSIAQTNNNGSNQSVAPAYNAATVGWVNKTSTATGGTLNLLTQSDCDSWDPANSYLGWCWNMDRLYVRTLVGYSSVPGSNNISKIEPDAATALGSHNADYTQWTYKLKPGLKYEDGTVITAADYKHALSRLFATDVINGGPSSYYLDTIAAPNGYAGPFKGAGDDPNITTPDPNTLVINLKTPYSNFDYLMALPASAPVPVAKDTGTQYTLHPVSSGPFKFGSYTPGKSVTFVRNPNFDQSTDTIAHPLVDQINLTVDSDTDDIDRRLQAGTADGRADNGVQATFQTQINNDPKLKANSDDPTDGSTAYMVIVPSVKPLDNIHCRMAVAYALNKRAIVGAFGGSYGGQIGNTMANPSVPGFDPNANPYPTGADGTGDINKAKSELQQCGQPNGFSVKEAFNQSARGTAVFNATQVALARVGIQVSSAPGASATYYSKYIGSPDNLKSQGLGLAQARWGADFPTGLGFFNSIVNGNNILPTGNTNYASLNDPKINDLLAQATKTPGTNTDLFKQVDAQVMANAVYIPTAYTKTLYYRNPRMVNVRCNFSVAFGIYDWVNVGIKS